MKIKLITTAFLAFFAIAFVGTASAQTATPKVTKSQINQQKRIVQGARSGELTRAEVLQLERQQRRVHKHKKATKADGKVTRRERRRLRAHQKAASRNIHRQKNDGQKRQ